MNDEQWAMKKQRKIQGRLGQNYCLKTVWKQSENSLGTAWKQSGNSLGTAWKQSGNNLNMAVKRPGYTDNGLES